MSWYSHILLNTLHFACFLICSLPFPCSDMYILFYHVFVLIFYWFCFCFTMFYHILICFTMVFKQILLDVCCMIGWFCFQHVIGSLHRGLSNLNCLLFGFLAAKKTKKQTQTSTLQGVFIGGFYIFKSLQ